MRHSFFSLLVLGLLAGCGGASVDSICDKVADCEGDAEREECVAEGNEYQQRAENPGCGDEFDDFLACIDDNFQCVNGSVDGTDTCESILEGCETTDASGSSSGTEG